jgi:hypothetical protein
VRVAAKEGGELVKVCCVWAGVRLLVEHAGASVLRLDDGLRCRRRKHLDSQPRSPHRNWLAEGYVVVQDRAGSEGAGGAAGRDPDHAGCRTVVSGAILDECVEGQHDFSPGCFGEGC